MEFFAFEQTNALRIYELIKVFSEFAEIIQGDLYWKDAKYFTRYFKAQDHQTFPKYILYGTHQETLAPLLLAFKHNIKVSPKAGASFYLVFYKRSDGSVHVKIDYNDTPEDFSGMESVIYSAVQSAQDTSLQIQEFQKYLQFLIKKWNHMFEVKNGETIKEICQSVYLPPPPGQ